jgi:hypothetical protein
MIELLVAAANFDFDSLLISCVLELSNQKV